MYVSPAVRTIDENPVSGETVELVVRFDPDATGTDVAGAVEAAGGRVVDDLQFGGLRVEVPQTAVGTVLDLPVDSVETAAVLGTEGGDAGEDVREL